MEARIEKCLSETEDNIASLFERINFVVDKTTDLEKKIHTLKAENTNLKLKIQELKTIERAYLKMSNFV